MLGILALFVSCIKSPKKANKLETLELKDYFDRQIKIPSNVSNLIPLYYVQAEIICVLGGADKIVGIGKLFANQSTIIDEHFKQLYQLPQVGIRNTINYEKIISLKPDIVFCGYEKEVTDHLDQLNIKNLSTFPKCPSQIAEEILQYGKIIDKYENAEKTVSFLNNEYSLVSKKTNIIKLNQRPRVYYARTDLFTTLGSGINSDIIELIGGISVTNHLPNDLNGIKVSLENLYDWNPEIIILRDRASVTPSDIYSDKRLKGINAVKNRRIYQETYGWTEFRLGMYFGLIEKSKWLHPELFKDLDPHVEYKKFVSLFQSFSK